MIGFLVVLVVVLSGGYILLIEMKKVLNYIIKGVLFGGKYKFFN